MAMLDYGAVVFKNGERYKEDELFPNIDELDICFYKNYIVYPEEYEIDGEKYLEKTISFGWNDKKSYRFTHNGNKYWVKEICKRVYKCEVTVNGDRYFAVFGYGIDRSKKIWDEIKDRYLGRQRADKVDNVLNRFDAWRKA